MDSATPRAQTRAHAPTPAAYTGAPAGVDGADLLYADVAARLRAVCAAMPPDAFDRLVRDICAMKRRWASDYGP